MKVGDRVVFTNDDDWIPENASGTIVTFRENGNPIVLFDDNESSGEARAREIQCSFVNLEIK